MINILKDTTNILYLTLTEKCNLTSPSYLMNIHSKNTLQDKVVRFTGDTSLNTARFNKLILIEDSVEDLNNGKISLTVGNYDYQVYETSTTTGTTLTNLNVVEIGQMTVSGSSNTTVTKFTNNKTITTFR